MTVLGIVLAMTGAVFAALAARMQHRVVSAASSGPTLRLRALGVLVRERTWVLGVLTMAVGGGLHSIALGVAPIIVVQPVGVLAVGMTAMLDARAGERGLSRRGWYAVGAITVGVAGFVGCAAVSTSATDASGSAALRAAQLVAAGVLGFSLLGMVSGGRGRGLAFASAGGMAYGLVSVLTRILLQQANNGGAGATLLAVGVGIGLALLIGGWLVQQAYASAPPHLVVACLTVVDPIVAVSVGAGLLGEAAAVTGSIITAGALCALLAIGGVLTLAHSSTAPRTGART